MSRMKPIVLFVCSAMLAALVQVQPTTSAAGLSQFTPTFRPDPKRGVQPTTSAAGLSQGGILREIRHELITIPYYDVFDWLEAEVRGDDTVVLRGQVVHATIRSEAESRVKRIEGVTRVINEIEVLPPSPNDDRLRIVLYRALLNWNSPLFRYAHQAVPPIHIIVKGGRAALKGVVATRQDAQLAYMKARSVPGLFEVKNELQVENARAR